MEIADMNACFVPFVDQWFGWECILSFVLQNNIIIYSRITQSHPEMILRFCFGFSGGRIYIGGG
jgi:hypothetical protein